MSDTHPISVAVAKKMRALRRGRGWTAEQLAGAVTSLGVPWKRGIVTALETGSRNSVSVDELLVLAWAFGVSPLELLGPVLEDPEPPAAPRLPHEIVVTRDRPHGWPRVTVDGETLPWLIQTVTVNDIQHDHLATCTITLEAELVVQANATPFQTREGEIREGEALLVDRQRRKASRDRDRQALAEDYAAVIHGPDATAWP